MGKVLLHPSMLYLQNLQIYTATYLDQPNKINKTVIYNICEVSEYSLGEYSLDSIIY